MKIFYHCYAGAHSSVVASALHCGILPLERLPSLEEITAVPYFDQTSPNLVGTPYFMGHDEYNNEVFFIGMFRRSDLVKRAIYSFFELCEIPQEQSRFIDALHVINLSTKIGGGMSRRFGCVRTGRWLSSWGVQRCYPGFVELVKGVKYELQQHQSLAKT